MSVSPEELAGLEVGALGLSETKLAELIADLPGASGSTSDIKPLIEAALLTTPGLSVQELLGDLGGTETPAELAQAVTDGASSPEALTSLLSDLSGSFSGEQLTGLQQIFERLLGNLTPTQLASLESALGKSGTLSELAGDLASGLASGSTSSALETLLSDVGSLTETSGSALAEALGTPLETLASELGVSTKTLSESTGVYTTLPSKEVLYVLTGPDGEDLIGVTPPSSTSVSTGSSSTPPGSTTSTTTTNNTTTPTVPSAVSSTKKAAEKVKIVRHSVKKHVLTLIVKLPSAGKVTITAANLKTAHRTVGKSRKVTFKIRLTRAGAASVRRHHEHHQRVKVKVKAAFKPKTGSKSSATTKVRFS